MRSHQMTIIDGGPKSVKVLLGRRLRDPRLSSLLQLPLPGLLVLEDFDVGWFHKFAGRGRQKGTSKKELRDGVVAVCEG